MNKMTLILILTSILGQAQDKVIEGIYDKKYVDTYTIVRFNKDKTFAYRWTSHHQTIELKGTYDMNGDTITLNSKEPWTFFDGSTFEFKNERWLKTGRNTIRQNDTINSGIIYSGTELIKNKQKEKILTKGLKSELYQYADSLITHVLKYNPTRDSLMIKRLNPTNDTNVTIRDYRDPNPKPAIILDSRIVDIESLNNYRLTSKMKIEALKDDKAIAIWGVRAANGIIVIQTK